MQFDNEKTRNVADVAARIMAGESIKPQQLDEKLHPNQQVLDVHEPDKDELTAKDFEMLRKKKKMKEENEVCPKCDGKGCEHCGGKGYHEEVEEEQAEQIDEVKMADLPSRKVQGKSYGASKPNTNPFDVLKGPKNKDLDAIKKDEKKMVPNWARGPNESVSTFSAMLEQYKETGLKSLKEWAKKKVVKEEPTQEEYEEELQTQKAKSEGKVKQPDLTKGDVMAVQQEEIEQIDEGERSANYIGTAHKSDPDYDKKLSDLKSRAIGGHRIRGRSPAPEHKEKYQEGGELKRPHQDIKPEHATRVDVYGRKGVKSVSEETEQIDELSKDTLQNYTQKAKAVSKNAKAYGSYNADPDDSDLADKNWKKHEKLEKGIMKAKEKMNKEEIEQIDEVGDTPAGRKVLSSYVNKALGDKNREKGLRKATSRLYKDNYYGKKNEEVVSESKAGWSDNNGTVKKYEPQKKAPTPHWRFNKDGSHTDMNTGKTHHRDGSVTEEAEQVDERHMTDAEMDKREDIVKGMKKSMQGFKDRYGDKAKNVMYATATKQAMKD